MDTIQDHEKCGSIQQHHLMKTKQIPGKKKEDIERSDGETIKPGMLKRPELDHVTPINVSSRPVSTGD